MSCAFVVLDYHHHPTHQAILDLLLTIPQMLGWLSYSKCCQVNHQAVEVVLLVRLHQLILIILEEEEEEEEEEGAAQS